MKQQISLREANQHLSKYIEAVERGDEVIITKRGKPVARLLSAETEPAIDPEQDEALEALFSLGINTEGRTYSRKELYDERLDELEERRNRQR